MSQMRNARTPMKIHTEMKALTRMRWRWLDVQGSAAVGHVGELAVAMDNCFLGVVHGWREEMRYTGELAEMMAALFEDRGMFALTS
jgi:hypothetical protein